MLDQLIIGEKSSNDDFGASVAERRIKDGAKKEIKDSVPFSNVTHDFSAINGEVYWEEKELEYIFEMVADSPEELEEMKISFKSWVMNVMNEKLYDPFINDYHFLATFKSIDIDDSEIEKATITVTFTAYPYMISNDERRYIARFTGSDGTVKETTIVAENNSSHRITPVIVSDIPFTLVIGDNSYSVPAGEIKDYNLKLAVGRNTIIFKSSVDGTIRLSYYEEVF